MAWEQHGGGAMLTSAGPSCVSARSGGELVPLVRQALGEAQVRLERERLHERVRRQNRRVQELNSRLERVVRDRTQAFLDALIAALDCRDNETQRHSRRVSTLARRLGLQLGVAEPELSVIEQGALLHDVGKIGVRDSILLKPGPLSPEEWKEMKQHVEIGWAMLQRANHLRPMSVIVLQHHERWEGSGYPHGLRGDEIGVGARIFHVVDALDAITSDRPYRRARSFAEARLEIASCSGTQFDPAVVDGFLAIEDEEWGHIRGELSTHAPSRVEESVDG